MRLNDRAADASEKNTLFYGDNFDIMRTKMNLRSVDLIYLDPPFKSQQTYNLLYRTLTGKPVPDQARAFCDTWDMDAEKEELSRAMPSLLREYQVDEYYVQFWIYWMRALRETQPHLLAYLIYMVRRLVVMRHILKDTGSIYLHCDPTASHYIKVMMDGIFGHANFQNEIVWKRTSAHSSAKRYGPVHDVILYYTRSSRYTWTPQYQEYDQRYLDAFYTHKDKDGRRWRRSDLTGAGIRHGETGKPWRGIDVTQKGRHWAWPPEVLDEMDASKKIHWPKKKGGMPMLKRYLDEQPGAPLQDVWTDIAPMHNLSPDRLGYQTQKPLPLLKRIILASTKPGDVVFDPFCGCGTTIYAAQETGRKWIGCDIAILAIRLVSQVLEERFRVREGSGFEVEGIPVSEEQARALFTKDPLQFQNWAIEKAGGFPMQRKSGDRGIDGRLYFETGRDFRSMVLSVKGGHLRAPDVRELRGVMEREPDCEMAGLISLDKPSKGMQEEAGMAGMYSYRDVSYPRIQLLTVADMFENRSFTTPTRLGARAISGQTALPYQP